MLEEIEEIQRKGYPMAKVWNIQKQQSCENADLVIANLVAEYMGVKSLVQKIKKSRARYVSVLIWDKRNRKSLSAFTGKKEEGYYLTAEDVISVFQENWLDLIYMKEDIEIKGVFFIRMDFQSVRTEVESSLAFSCD